MARFKEYANLFDKVSRMVASNMWAAPIWYAGARRSPPPTSLVWDAPPKIVLPELDLRDRLMERIPILKLELSNGGVNMYTESSLSWKFVKRQYQYMQKLNMSEEAAFVRTEQDMDPQIHTFVKSLGNVKPKATSPYSWLNGSGLESEPAAQAAMKENSTLSIYSIKNNLTAARSRATVERARKRAKGEKPSVPFVTHLIEEKIIIRPNVPAVMDPLFGPSNLFDRRKRQMTKQVDENGLESVQRRFMQKPSKTHEALRKRLVDGAGKRINNPTAEYIALRILPSAEEVALFRESVERDPEEHEQLLNDFRFQAAKAELQPLPLHPNQSDLVGVVLQAEKLQVLRSMVAASNGPKQASEAEAEAEEAEREEARGVGEAEEKEAVSRLSGEDQAKVDAFLEQWYSPDFLKAKRHAISMELSQLDGDAAESAWQTKKGEEALERLNNDLFGVDTKDVNPEDHEPKRYKGWYIGMKTMQKSKYRQRIIDQVPLRVAAQKDGIKW